MFLVGSNFIVVVVVGAGSVVLAAVCRNVFMLVL